MSNKEKDKDKDEKVKFQFTESETVLCYHGPLLYEAKVKRIFLEIIKTIDLKLL
jgi:hypothetical protein